MMASSKSVMRIAQAARTRSTATATTTSRTFHSCRRHLDENKPDKPERDQDPVSFRLSMYQSTFDRVQREKAEEARISTLRAAKNRSNVPLTLGLILGTLHAVPFNSS